MFRSHENFDFLLKPLRDKKLPKAPTLRKKSPLQIGNHFTSLESPNKCNPESHRNLDSAKSSPEKQPELRPPRRRSTKREPRPSETRVQPAGTPVTEDREKRQVQEIETHQNKIEIHDPILESLSCLAVAPKREIRSPRRCKVL